MSGIARDNKGWKLSGLRAHLRSLRGQFGYTQEQVADEAGYAIASFRSWENGHVEPPVSALVNWCLVFNHRLCLADFNVGTAHKREKQTCEHPESHTEAA